MIGCSSAEHVADTSPKVSARADATSSRGVRFVSDLSEAIGATWLIDCGVLAAVQGGDHRQGAAGAEGCTGTVHRTIVRNHKVVTRNHVTPATVIVVCRMSDIEVLPDRTPPCWKGQLTRNRSSACWARWQCYRVRQVNSKRPDPDAYVDQLARAEWREASHRECRDRLEPVTSKHSELPSCEGGIAQAPALRN